jgi:hypothetical protein
VEDQWVVVRCILAEGRADLGRGDCIDFFLLNLLTKSIKEEGLHFEIVWIDPSGRGSGLVIPFYLPLQLFVTDLELIIRSTRDLIRIKISNRSTKFLKSRDQRRKKGK